MMISIVIICEYNLFHNGHLRQINIIRDEFMKKGKDTTVISLMSGNWVQRGGPACLPAHVRAETALKCGTDLVLELPFPWSSGSAEYFARGAIDILNSFKSVDYLCFGSESGDLGVLTGAADNILSDAYITAYAKAKKQRRSGTVSEIILRDDIYFQLYGKRLPVLPNDILGLEYLRALRMTGSRVKPMVVLREGNETATESRRMLYGGNLEGLRTLVPCEAFEIYMQNRATCFDKLGTAVLARLRLADRDELASFEGAAGGLAGRLCNSAAKASNLNELFEMAATKRYTNARLRRTVINCMLKVTAGNLKERPRFTRLLAANKKGTDFLRSNRGSDIIILTKPSHVKRHQDDAVFIDQINRRQRSEALYSLARSESAEDDLRRTPFISND